MKRGVAVGAVASTAIAACFFEPTKPGATTGGDAGVDSAPCVGSNWSAPVALSELDGVGSAQYSPFLSADKTELWFTSSNNSLWHTVRPSTTGTWGTATQVFDLQFGSADNTDPHFVVSDNSLVGWYAKMQGDDNVYEVHRDTPSGTFGSDTMLAATPDGSNTNEEDPAISGDGTIMVITTSVGGTSLPGELSIMTRNSVGDPFGAYTKINAVNSSGDDCCASLSEDGNTLYFSSNRSGNYAIYVSTRGSNGSVFTAPVPFMGPDPSFDNSDPVIARDNTVLIFSSDHGDGHPHLWRMDHLCQ